MKIKLIKIITANSTHAEQQKIQTCSQINRSGKMAKLTDNNELFLQRTMQIQFLS